jgi:hypothetical protein
LGPKLVPDQNMVGFKFRVGGRLHGVHVWESISIRKWDDLSINMVDTLLTIKGTRIVNGWFYKIQHVYNGEIYSQLVLEKKKGHRQL